MSQKGSQSHTKLGELFATAICGNDILSSALYVSGIAAIFAGVYAPLVLLAVGAVLFFYRTVYREVVEALPVNGGAYNALLNGTSKTIAALAGVMTILSYIATAVISAKTAVEYLFKFIEEVLHANHVVLSFELHNLVIPIIIVVLFLFALLVISGVKDSAKVAAFIFGFHIFTLIGFVAFGAYMILSGNIASAFEHNYSTTLNIVATQGGLLKTLFLAFSASLLGVSGFESSANFVEEQKPGVFKKTLRNMLIGVAIFNPLIALVITQVMPIAEIIGAKDFLLAEAALNLGGVMYLGWIAINAFMVLCGAVLTSYVGVSGLVNRMSLDQCLPSFLSKENSKGSHPRIIIAFFVLCTSILLLTRGELLSLAGVYTISFLGVMSLFALGNLILRQTRTELKRSYKAPFFFVVLALLATLSGLIGNMIIDQRNVFFFLLYFIPAILLVLTIIYQKDVIRALRRLSRPIKPLHNYFNKLYTNITNVKFYAFVHHTGRLYNILDYINQNENGWNIRLIHCKNGDDGEKEKIKRIIPALREAGAFSHFNIELEYLPKNFSPETIDEYAKKNNIEKSRIFIGSIHESHDFDYADLGGVRIIGG